jgi:hypothetical protein
MKPFHGMQLVQDERVPANNYVITDAKGRVLSGGDIEKGLQWKADGRTYRGDAARIHAPEAVCKRLLAELAAGIKPENDHGDRHPQ